jgi:hypothetical protein
MICHPDWSGTPLGRVTRLVKVVPEGAPTSKTASERARRAAITLSSATVKSVPPAFAAASVAENTEPCRLTTETSLKPALSLNTRAI